MEEEISSFINQMIGQIQIVEPTKKINLVGKKFNSNGRCLLCQGEIKKGDGVELRIKHNFRDRLVDFVGTFHKDEHNHEVLSAHKLKVWGYLKGMKSITEYKGDIA